MVNLHYDYSALVIYLVIVFSMLIRNVIRGTTSKLFFGVLLLSALTTIADIFSELRSVPPMVREVFDYLYFTGGLLIPLLYAIYIYSSIGMLHYVRTHKRVWIAMATPLAIFFAVLIANIFTHCAFYVLPNGDYVRAPLQPILIATTLAYVFIGITIIIRWHRIIEKQKLRALLTFFPIITAALMAQQLFQGLELNMFGLAISELVISFTVQRKDEHFNHLTGTKTYESALDDFRKVFLTKEKTYVIYLKIKNQNGIKHSMGTSAYNRFVSALCKRLMDTVKKFKSFTDMYYIHEEIYSFKISSTQIDNVRSLAYAISDCLNTPIQTGNINICVDKTICIVRIPEDIDNLEDLMNFRMDFHKKLPESKSVLELADYINSMDFKIKNELNSIIARALEEHNFEMYYQPIYSVQEQKFVSAEALIRLKDPKYGFIPPSLFIPAAESTGLIHPIGDYVNDAVFSFISRYNMDELGLKYIELNLSVNQCIESDLVQKIERLTKKYDVSPDRLNFEITETEEDFDPDVMNANINTLYLHGYSFSLDDYGTGYSNIKRLTALPLDIVKLDKTFVDEMEDPQMWTVIVNNINMFKEMKKTVLVEGVEEESKVNALTALGCDYIQGYYFSKPLAEKDFVEFLKTHNCAA